MSLIVFAGASQFVAVPMLASGASPWAVILTTYVINMRHYLMAATLAPSFSGFPPPGARPDRARHQRRVVRDRGDPVAPRRIRGLHRQRRSRSTPRSSAASRSARCWAVSWRIPRRSGSTSRSPRCSSRWWRPSSGSAATGSSRPPAVSSATGDLRHAGATGQLAHRRRGTGGQRHRGAARARRGGAGVRATVVPDDRRHGRRDVPHARADAARALAAAPRPRAFRLWLRLIPLGDLPALAVPLVLASGPAFSISLGLFQPEWWARSSCSCSARSG